MSQQRIIIWTTVRAMSTAIQRVLVNSPDVKAYQELYSDAFFHGADRIGKLRINTPVTPGFKFQEIKDKLESTDIKERYVVLKDFAEAVLPKLEYLPVGYTHTFLIRNPKKVLASLYKLGQKYPNEWESDLLDDHFSSAKALWELFQYLSSHVTQQPIIVIDADDVRNDPPIMFKKYCDAVGLHFDESMLHWEANTRPDFLSPFWENWFTDIIKSDGFKKRSPGQPNVDVDVSVLPREFQEVIEESMPYYNKLYEIRLHL
ncbi:uncharacterized protein LOC144451719 [Glandiceps talaboti]